MVKVSEKYEVIEFLNTPKFKFPLATDLKYHLSKYKFEITFAENGGQTFSTGQLWNFGFMDNYNQNKIDEKIKNAEEYIDQEVKRSIHRSLSESRRESVRVQRIEARVNRIMDKY